MLGFGLRWTFASLMTRAGGPARSALPAGPGKWISLWPPTQPGRRDQARRRLPATTLWQGEAPMGSPLDAGYGRGQHEKLENCVYSGRSWSSRIALGAAGRNKGRGVGPEIARLLEKHKGDFLKGDADAWAALYAKDATFIGGQRNLQSRRAIRDSFAQGFKDFSDWHRQRIESFRSESTTRRSTVPQRFSTATSKAHGPMHQDGW